MATLAVGLLHASLPTAAIAADAPSPNGEPDAAQVEKARTLFQRGVERFQAGDLEGARRDFVASDAAHHASDTVYNIARCHERLGQVHDAIERYEAYLAEAGEDGAYRSAASLALAELRARSTRLTIATSDTSARAFLDAQPLAGTSPWVRFIPAGTHHVVVTGTGWRDERDVQATGSGDQVELRVDMPSGEATTRGARRRTAERRPTTTRRRTDSTADTEPERPSDGAVFGVGFALIPYHFLGVTTPNASNATNRTASVAGLYVSAGLRLTERVVVGVGGAAGIGPEGDPAYGYYGGPRVAVRIWRSLSLSASFIGGQLESEAAGIRFGTDLVFGATAGVEVEVVRKRYGRWIFSLTPGLLLTERRNDNTAIIAPFGFGLEFP